MPQPITTVVGDAKRCATCKAWKPLDAFYANRNRACGRSSYCKACEGTYVHAYRARLRAADYIRARAERAPPFASLPAPSLVNLFAELDEAA